MFVPHSAGEQSIIRATYELGGGDRKQSVLCFASVKPTSADEVLNVIPVLPEEVSFAAQAANPPALPLEYLCPQILYSQYKSVFLLTTTTTTTTTL